jgi:hypothetical protein
VDIGSIPVCTFIDLHEKSGLDIWLSSDCFDMATRDSDAPVIDGKSLTSAKN